VLAIGAQIGCTREFYREWANQDVSEAVFEKSRDPRWRLDTFSVEPPALSRFADPYDQEVPPAPPDDPAAEALSPVPQWPDNRLLIPAEGTGYLELLDKWQREADETKDPFLSSNTAVEPPNRVVGPARPPQTPSPFIPLAPPTGNKPPTGTGSPRGAQPRPGSPPASGNPMQSGPQSRYQAQPAGSGPVLSGAQARYQAQPLSGAQARYQAQPASGTAKTTETTVGLREKPSTSASSASAAPSVSPSANDGPSQTGPQARNHPRPAGVLPLTSETIIRLQDGPSMPLGSAVFGKTDITDRSNRNSGPKSTGSTPISVSKVNPSAANPKIPVPRSSATFGSVRRDGAKDVKDKTVKLAAFQNNGTAAQPAPNQGAGAQTERLKLLSPGQDTSKPSETMEPNITVPPALDLKQIEEAGKMSQEQAAELSGVLVPRVALQTDEKGYGYPKGTRPYKINMQQAWMLALMNARYYQFNLEQVYLMALPVTLQRFSFDPQFYAGMSPSTSVPQTNFSVAGAVGVGFPQTPGVITSNTYTYATRFAPSGPLSTLNMGTVAGVGKLFSSGGQLVMGFANEVMFNFLGKNSSQPNVISALPISFVQPLLRGGGRAVTLEPLTQAERNLLYQVRAFALFRQQFFVVTLTGGSVQNFGVGYNLPGFSSIGNTDPTIGFLPVVFNLVEVEIDRKNLAFLENLVNLYSELIQGEASGLSQLQVDQVMQRLISARLALFVDEVNYRTQLDEFKMQMSIPPDTPLIVDMSLAQPFYDVFNAVDAWQRRADRSLSELPTMIAKIPELEDIDVEGRSVLAPYRNYRSTLSMMHFQPEDEEGLEDLLQSAVRIALEYRMDMMNNRAQLYDAWRQIRVTANALKGVLNVAVTNNVYAPLASPNPLDFLSQARQFSLAINAELPLVRVAERNAFRTALINYQRLRRSLQTQEDNLKIQLRNDLRTVHLAYITYEISKRNFELNVRLKDQSFEQIVAPPAGGTQQLAQSASAATQTTNLLNFQGNLINAQLALTNGWQAYQTARLIVYRDIGILPYDEWEAFSELYPSQYHGPIIGHAPPGGRGFTPPPEARTATPESR